jgi:hypothetical protein
MVGVGMNNIVTPRTGFDLFERLQDIRENEMSTAAKNLLVMPEPAS